MLKFICFILLLLLLEEELPLLFLKPWDLLKLLDFILGMFFIFENSFFLFSELIFLSFVFFLLDLWFWFSSKELNFRVASLLFLSVLLIDKN
jgi:hypothetical protein